MPPLDTHDTVSAHPSRRSLAEVSRHERELAENLLDMAHVIVLSLDSEGRIMRYSRSLEEMSGRCLEEMQGSDWFETFLPPQDHERIREVFASVLAGKTTDGVVNRITTTAGDTREIEWYSRPLRIGDQDEVVGLLAIGLDVSERARLEHQFLHVQKMEAVGRLAGGIAHDFNTLLGSITGYSEILLEGLPAEHPLRHPAEQILRCAIRGARLTDKLLAFSRHHEIESRPVDLWSLIGDMWDMLDRLVADDIELIRSCRTDHTVVEADPSQLEQVVMNLVVNASDAMPRGGQIGLDLGSVELRAGVPCPYCGDTAQAGRHLRLSVRDTGMGIDDETLAHIFEPFFTTKEPGEGTGLGLSTAYGIVQRAGGCISVESRLGKGSEFRVLLPLVLDADPPPTRSSDSSTAAGADGARGTERILVVEDDPVFRELVSEVLRSKGYEAHEAASPDEAEALADDLAARGLGIDLLISDVVMPGMPGTALSQRLAERFPDMKTLLMSGYHHHDLQQRGARTDPASCIKKPFSVRELGRRVRDLLQGPGLPDPSDPPGETSGKGREEQAS